MEKLLHALLGEQLPSTLEALLHFDSKTQLDRIEVAWLCSSLA